jgi:hypothetical protein
MKEGNVSLAVSYLVATRLRGHNSACQPAAMHSGD